MDDCIEVWENFKSLESNACFVFDKNVFDSFSSLFQDINLDRCCFIKSPEFAKSWEGAHRLLHFFAEKKLSKTSKVYAIGGGAIGDLTGFCAMIFKRGLELHLVPTTLLSFIDASIGGKNAINFEGVKNLVGGFYLPKKIIHFLPFLDTLIEKEYLSGYAEALKIALVASSSLWDELAFLPMSYPVLKKCIHLKQKIVREDPLDQGGRHILNFGHTFAHAYEAASGYTLPHGYAVACGLLVEIQMSFAKGKTQESELNKVKDRLMKNYAPFKKIVFDQIAPFLLLDKKNKDGQILVHGFEKIGQAPFLERATLNEFKLAYEKICP